MVFKIDPARKPKPNFGNLAYPIYDNDKVVANYITDFRSEDGEIVFVEGGRIDFPYVPFNYEQVIEERFTGLTERAQKAIEEYLNKR